jgi:hypothetical protein
MVPRIASSVRSRREHLRRLSIIYTIEIRMKIVVELFRREMSPKEFYEEFGGGSVERVAQHFEYLAKHFWLRALGFKGRDGRRRGRSETLYRATDTPYFDSETWALLPYSLQLAFSWGLFKVIARELRQGIEGAFFEECTSRDLTCTPLELDELGWTRVIARLDAQFESIFEEQDDAKIRAARTGEELIRAGILLSGFESPRSNYRIPLDLADPWGESPIPFPECFAPIFADDLCMEILAELNRRAMSVKQFHREFASNTTEWAVRYRFNKLKKLGFLVVVKKVKKGGAREFIYRATKPIVNDLVWVDVPDALREPGPWKALERFSGLVKDAIDAGTFDIRADRHMSWMIVNLDHKGFENAVSGIEALAAFIRDEEEGAKKRIDSGAKPLTMVVALSAIAPIEPVKMH